MSTDSSWKKFALSLPEVTEEPHFEKVSLRVRGKIFATIPPGDEYVHLFIDDDATRALVESAPSTFAALHWGGRPAGVRIKLNAVDQELLCELVEESWRRKAPKTLVARLDAGRSDALPEFGTSGPPNDGIIEET